jgi:hypothetical protein
MVADHLGSCLVPAHLACCCCCPPAGRFAFVEFRTDELATTAMTLDKTELCGRQMNIGRPKGYVPGNSSATGAREGRGCMLLARVKVWGVHKDAQVTGSCI